MKAVVKILLGLSATALVGVLSILFDILPGSAVTAEGELQLRVNQQLAAGDFSWAQARIDGQKAILSGDAPSHDDVDNALAAVNGAIWRGGVIVGGITAVDYAGVLGADRLPVADPFLWIAERQNDAIVIAGYAPSEHARREISKLVREIFPGVEISGSLDLASGAPPERDWLIAASTSLHALARLDDGAIEATGAKFVLTGAANSKERADVLRGLMSSLPDGMMGVAAINVRPPDQISADATSAAEVSETGAPAATGGPAANSASIAREAAAGPILAQAATDACRIRLRQKIDAHRIGFAVERSNITGESRSHLLELAGMMRECPQFSFEITGHTDTTGGDFSNRRLSRRRADAVAAFLVKNGVPARRLAARGAGSAEPLADNGTLEGRRRNRRIEIDLIFDPQ